MPGGCHRVWVGRSRLRRWSRGASHDGSHPTLDRRRGRDFTAVLIGESDNRPNRESKEIELTLTAGIGSDHVDLKAPAVRRQSCRRDISTNISVAEHVGHDALFPRAQLSFGSPVCCERRASFCAHATTSDATTIEFQRRQVDPGIFLLNNRRSHARSESVAPRLRRAREAQFAILPRLCRQTRSWPVSPSRSDRAKASSLPHAPIAAIADRDRARAR